MFIELCFALPCYQTCVTSVQQDGAAEADRKKVRLHLTSLKLIRISCSVISNFENVRCAAFVIVAVLVPSALFIVSGLIGFQPVKIACECAQQP